MRWLIALLLVSSAAAVAAQEQTDRTIDAATRARVIAGIGKALEERYVFPEVAAKVTKVLKANAAAKKYDKITSAVELARTLTDDVQAVSHDKHMRVGYRFEPIGDVGDPDADATPAEIEQMKRVGMRWNQDFFRAERLAGNIGYLDFRAFGPPSLAADTAAGAMAFLADCDALIVDLRQNGGGEPEMVAVMVSYLYPADAHVHINDIYQRKGNLTTQYWTLPVLPGRRFAGKDVVVLTSKRTFSGAEEFAYDVQQLKRGTIVGETTGGGANPGGPIKVDEHFAINVPTGRAVNPYTHTNWEGVGVVPDVKVPAEQALDTAHLLLLKKRQEVVSAKEAPGLRREIDEAIERLGKAAK